MKKLTLLLLLTGFVLCSKAQTNILVFDNVLYFDGYAATVSTPPPPPGVLRLKNSLYSRQLTQAELASIGSSLHMSVWITPACDNYDRIGNVNMAFVHKDSTTYKINQVKRIELGRFITPFMNMNLSPNIVGYEYDIDNIAYLMKDTSILNNYNIWVELEIFGVPYAASTQIPGCSGHKDVWYGSLKFTTNTAIPEQKNNVLVPMAIAKNFNNYQAGATDTLGKTTKKFTVTVPKDLTDAAYFLITSNHGAGTGGEEYIRRDHYVYVDDVLKLHYKPGRTSCEPFRQYNTQPNGIYGASPKSDAQWQSFSNWCPGDVIDIHRINLGALSAGDHTFRIVVPNAQFAGSDGNFPLSVYLHGKTSGTLNEPENQTVPPPVVTGDDIKIYPNPAISYLNIEANGAEAIRLIDALGHTVYQNNNPTSTTIINTSKFPPGVYIAHLKVGGNTHYRKIVIAK